MSSSPSYSGEKKHWWLSTRKLVDKYVRDARGLISARENSDIGTALNLLDSALALSPRFETALELKARALLILRRFKDVADMLQDYIPSYKVAADESSSSLSSDISSQQLSRDRIKLLSDGYSARNSSFKCLSVSDLKKKVMAGLSRSCEKEGQWRYLVLGQACYHLGLMEDAMVLLQTGKRIASAAFRRESVCWSDDSFSISNAVRHTGELPSSTPPSTPTSSLSDAISHLLSTIKLLLRRRTAALAALDAGLPSESIRHFSKIIESRHPMPQSFLSECFIQRASAFRAAGRLAESIADCNRALALNPSSIAALTTRAAVLDSIHGFSDCLRDLEHLKLLYDSVLRDRKLPGPMWRRHHHSIRYHDVSASLCSVVARIQELRQRITATDPAVIDYHGLFGLHRGCSRSELERAHLLLSLRHRPDKSTAFVDRCDFVDDRDIDAVKDQAKMSALLLYRLLQKGHSHIAAAITEEEEAEKQRQRAAAVAAVAAAAAMNAEAPPEEEKKPVFQGVFCRDMAVVGSLLAQVGFNRPIPVKYEALSC